MSSTIDALTQAEHAIEAAKKQIAANPTSPSTADLEARVAALEASYTALLDRVARFNRI